MADFYIVRRGAVASAANFQSCWTSLKSTEILKSIEILQLKEAVSAHSALKIMKK